jgi:small-conductance mechanosensitive channel
MIEDKERRTVEELMLIFLKILICGLLFFLRTRYEDIPKQYPLLGVTADAMLVFLTPSLAVSILRLVIIYWYVRKHRLKSNIKDNFILGINRIVSILNTILIVLALMVFFGQNPKEFLTSITIVAAAIALTFKDYITNMINGLIIMFSDRLSLGDHIKVQDIEGKILDITLINVILQNEDSDMVIIPNSVVFSSVIINQSKQNTKKLSVEFEMSLKYGYTPDFLEEHLANVVARYDQNVISGGLTIKTVTINQDKAVFKVQVLLNHYDRLKEREIRRALNTAIMKLSRKEDTVLSK